MLQEDTKLCSRHTGGEQAPTVLTGHSWLSLVNMLPVDSYNFIIHTGVASPASKQNSSKWSHVNTLHPLNGELDPGEKAPPT